MDCPEEAENGQNNSGIFKDVDHEQIKVKLCPKIIF